MKALHSYYGIYRSGIGQPCSLKKPLSLLLAASMLSALCTCGSPAASGAAPASSAPETAAESAAATEADAPETAVPADSAPAEEASSPEESAAPAVTIEYPIPGEHTFTMVSVLRMNAAEAMGDKTYSDTPPHEAMREATGVSIDFNLLGESTYSEKMNLMMASGDLPDMFGQTVSQYDSNLLDAIEDNILLDMEPLLADNAPDYKALLDSDPNFASGVYNTDGTLCQFAGRSIARVSQGLLIRGDWLEDLGLEAPKNFDELTDVLRTFKNEKGASNALLVNFECDSGLAPFFNTSFMGFRMVGYQRVEPNSDELICSYASEGFIDYLNYLHSLFAEGIITDDFMTTGKEYGNWESSYYSGKCGVWQDDCKYTDPAFRENGSDSNWKAVPFALSDIDVHVTQANVVAINGKLFITTACEEPEVAMQYVNYCYTAPGKDLVAFGVEDLTYTKDADGKIAYTDLMTNNSDGMSFDIANVYYTPAQWLPTDQQQQFLDLQYCPEATAAYQLWTEEYGDDSMLIPSACTLDAEEMTEYFNLAGDVLTAFTEAASRVVTGDLTEADYRQTIADLESSGLGRMDDIYAGAYARYLENAE